MKNRIIRLESRAYRYCHHEFEHLTVTEAAAKMEISDSKVRRLLKSLKRKAPQLFPILTKQQFQVYRMITEHGLTQMVIATIFEVEQSTISKMVSKMKADGMPGLDVKGLGDTVSYDKSMDKYIQQKF